MKRLRAFTVLGAALIAASAVTAQPAAAVQLACDFPPGNRSAVARICMKDSGQIDGAFATWKNVPITFDSGAAVGDWVKNYVDIPPVLGTSIEMGLRSTKAGAVGRTYEPYWAESSGQTYQEHAIAPARGPASADGLQHSYMVLRSGRTTQWDVLYDFNPVGRTTLQTQGYAEGFTVQLETNNLRNTTIGEMEDRFQYLAPDGQWLRFDRTKVSTQVTATCGSNTPPLCFNATLEGSPKAIAWRVSKPAGAVSASLAPQHLSVSETAVLNGVDQRALAACMASDPARCMKDVPGLARCVQARLLCNNNALAARRPAATFKAADSRLAAEQVKRLAATRFHLAEGQMKARAITADAYDQAAGTRLSQTWGADLPLLVATSTGKARAGKTDTRYAGLTAVYDPASGQLLHAALGLQRPFA